MNFSKKKEVWLCLIAMTFTFLVIGTFLGTDLLKVRSKTDLQFSQDLAALSGMSQKTVLKLYDSIGNWDTVRDNIFVYKRIFALSNQDAKGYDQVFHLAKKYPSGEILAAYEFLDTHTKDFEEAPDILSEHAEGKSLENVLASFDGPKLYKVYQPAGEQQVRKWLANGYLPQDIINADSIAKAKDIRITDVLALKTRSNTWEQVGKTLHYQFQTPKISSVSIAVKGTSGTRTMTGTDYENVVKQSNRIAEETEKRLEDEVEKEFGLTNAQLQSYKEQGYTIHDIQNAARLAKQKGGTLDKVLQARKKARDWETVIRTYNG